MQYVNRRLPPSLVTSGSTKDSGSPSRSLLWHMASSTSKTEPRDTVTLLQVTRGAAPGLSSLQLTTCILARTSSRCLSSILASPDYLACSIRSSTFSQRSPPAKSIFPSIWQPRSRIELLGASQWISNRPPPSITHLAKVTELPSSRSNPDSMCNSTLPI